ncbi:MAG: glycosyltransferase family 1 protein [Elusimicrobiota bacterium]|nr:glycosyltransferase family 4 protein [Endomicrobiia bacterium]MDW8166435.1 glycosyltransferase family 1 protein [Elusimicrobiota bacterium]
MKIAFNAIRVSNKAGSGFDTFIINFINEFAKYVYSKPELNIEFDVYTLYPKHFIDVKKENIKRVWKFKVDHSRLKSSNILFKDKYNSEDKEIKFFQTINSKLLHIKLRLKTFFGDYFRMFWTQFIFPFYSCRYDYVISLTEYEAMLLCLTKQIIILHSIVPFLFPQFKDNKYKLYTYLFLPKILNSAYRIVSVSETIKKEINELFKISKDKVFVIYEGVDTKKFYHLDNNEKTILKKFYGIEGDFILAIGHSHPIKNLSGVIKAYEILKQKYKIKLIVVGYFNTKIVFPKDVIYLGHIPNENLYILYTTAKCFVFPTLHEGFGLPPLEAMACGCPVVVSNRGSLPEVCGDAAVYVDPYNPQDIANGILKVLTDENLRQQLIKKGFEQVKKFTWRRSVELFVDLVLKNAT